MTGDLEGAQKHKAGHGSELKLHILLVCFCMS